VIKNLVVAAIVCASAERLHAQATVPSSLLESVGRSPIEFTVLLAEAAVSSGLEVQEPGDARTRPVVYAGADSSQRVPATQLVTAFNAVHSDYHASMIDGVFVIRPVAGNADLLDQQAPIASRTTITGRMQAARVIFGMPGVALNSLGHEGDDHAIVLDGTGRRKIIDILNQIVTQSPSAWQVTTRKQGNEWRVIAFGFMRKDGSTSMQRLVSPGGGRE
jgi:hypothetical protein